MTFNANNTEKEQLPDAATFDDLAESRRIVRMSRFLCVAAWQVMTSLLCADPSVPVYRTYVYTTEFCRS